MLDFGLAKLVETVEGASHVETTVEDRTTGIRRERRRRNAGLHVARTGHRRPSGRARRHLRVRLDAYEMVTGRRAFQGASAAETLAQILRDHPKPPCELVPDVPRDLERLILRSLRKDPDRRLQYMADVKVELQDIAEERASLPPSPAPASRRRWRGLATMLPLALAAGGGFLLWGSRESSMPAARVVTLTSSRGIEATPTLSPDGSQVAFAWDGEQPSDKVRPDFDVWLKLVGGSDARRLTTGPDDDEGPSWSPDGRQIAFHRGKLGGRGHIYLVSPLGGRIRKVSDFPAAGSETTWLRGAAVPQLSWSPDGRLIAAARAHAAGEDAPGAGGIHLVPIGGGEPRPITRPKPPAFDRDPAFSPDGRRLAYASCIGGLFGACEVASARARAGLPADRRASDGRACGSHHPRSHLGAGRELHRLWRGTHRVHASLARAGRRQPPARADRGGQAGAVARLQPQPGTARVRADDHGRRRLTRPRACRTGPLRVSLINQSPASDDSLGIATREASAIWEKAGLRLTWIPFPVARQLEHGGVVFVIIRPAFPPAPHTADVSHRRQTPLGRVSFSDEGRPANLIEVSFESVRATVMRATHVGRPIAGLPPNALGPLVGRALGRVVAREVGHWLLGRGHAKEGLMKPRLRGHELVDGYPPPLPRRWTVSGEALPLNDASRCELGPHAL